MSKKRICVACNRPAQVTNELCTRCFRIKWRFLVEPRDIVIFEAEHGFRCQICETVAPTGKHLVIDQDERTGTIRGMLCKTCRNNVQRFEVIKTKKKMLAYLEKPSIPFRYVDGASKREYHADVETSLTVLSDITLPTLRAKARKLAPLVCISEEAAMSRLRRVKKAKEKLDNMS